MCIHQTQTQAARRSHYGQRMIEEQQHSGARYEMSIHTRFFDLPATSAVRVDEDVQAAV